MTQIFWDTFWANLFSSLAVVAILAIVGLASKAKITRNLKKFIAAEVDAILKQINK